MKVLAILLAVAWLIAHFAFRRPLAEWSCGFGAAHRGDTQYARLRDCSDICTDMRRDRSGTSASNLKKRSGGKVIIGWSDGPTRPKISRETHTARTRVQSS